MTTVLDQTMIRALIFLSAAAACLAAAPSPATAQPSFDCAKASTLVEKLICGDPTLVTLDTETARLFDLARDASESTRGNVIRAQEDWLKARNDCTSSTDTGRCLAEAYVERISKLRETYVAARRATGGISLGPFAGSCDNGPSLKVTFVNSNPSYAYISGPKESFVLKQALSGSGARYQAQYPKGQARLWNKGNNALIALPGGKDVNCALKPLEK
jgi:uncharacterized protein